MKSDVVMGGDIGGTHMRIALVEENGNFLHWSKTATDVRAGAKDVVNRLILQCREGMAVAARMERTVSAFGLGVAGKIDRLGGTVLFSPNLPSLARYPLAEVLRSALALPVFMENDADSFGMGENLFGAGRGISNWIGLTLGTGVGGCIILGGHLWRGDDLGYSGEFGHMVIDPNGPECACGLKGCLEAHASSSALYNGVRELVARGELRDGPLHEAWTAGNLTSEQIHRQAAQGDIPAARLFHRMGWALGLVIAGQFSALGIRHAVIGGGVSKAWDQFIAPLKQSLNAHSSMLKGEEAVVLRTELGDKAALIGSAYLAKLQLSPPFRETKGIDTMAPEIPTAVKF
jgi:glucokinase